MEPAPASKVQLQQGAPVVAAPTPGPDDPFAGLGDMLDNQVRRLYTIR